MRFVRFQKFQFLRHCLLLLKHWFNEMVTIIVIFLIIIIIIIIFHIFASLFKLWEVQFSLYALMYFNESILSVIASENINLNHQWRIRRQSITFGSILLPLFIYSGVSINFVIHTYIHSSLFSRLSHPLVSTTNVNKTFQ